MTVQPANLTNHPTKPSSFVLKEIKTPRCGVLCQLAVLNETGPHRVKCGKKYLY